jgi:tRNA(adenine34) deaminase
LTIQTGLSYLPWVLRVPFRRFDIRPSIDDETWMEEAIQLAIEAGSAGEVPVGAVVVSEGVVLGRGRNRMVERSDPRAHAEMVAIDDARERSGKARLDGATLYVTLEPCPQCAGAILLVRFARVVFGAWDSRLGAAGSQFDLLSSGVLGDIRIRPEVLSDRCSSLLSEWFRAERRRE